jgi:hypothetical protein
MKAGLRKPINIMHNYVFFLNARSNESAQRKYDCPASSADLTHSTRQDRTVIKQKLGYIILAGYKQ